MAEYVPRAGKLISGCRTTPPIDKDSWKHGEQIVVKMTVNIDRGKQFFLIYSILSPASLLTVVPIARTI